MNDDFLQRVRKPPSPEFLARLKERLDRQPAPPSQPRRWSFVRGLLIGTLVGGSAFAITTVSLNSTPHAMRALVRAPMEFLARQFSDARDSDQSNRPDHHGVVPLGSAWIPNRSVTGQTPQIETAPTALDSRQQSSGAAAATSSNPEPLSTSGAGSAPGTAQAAPTNPYLESFTIVASPSTFALAKHVAGGRVKVELEAHGIPLERLCRMDIHRPSEAIEVSHRITRAEFRICKSYHSSIIELKIGYQAVMLARAKLYGPLRLSSRDLFLALSSRLPDDSHTGSLLDNPNATWNQVDSDLQYEQIQVLGPAPASGPGQVVQDLLLAPGCDKDPRVAALRDRDSTRLDEICQKIRGDAAYVSSGSTAGWAFVDRLVGNPTVIGVFSLEEFKFTNDRLTPISIDGVEPTAANIANGTYPASRALYLYANAYNVSFSYLFNFVVRNSMEVRDFNGGEQDTWAFVQLDDAERAATLDTARKLKPLQF
jgi:phosphate transport system substrate-binding protein